MYQNLIQKVSSKKKVAFHALLAILLFYFIFHAIGGNRGIIAYFKMSEKLQKATEDLDRIRMERMEIEHKANLLKSPVDKDMLDEQARRVLGVAGQNEKVFVTEEAK